MTNIAPKGTAPAFFQVESLSRAGQRGHGMSGRKVNQTPPALPLSVRAWLNMIETRRASGRVAR